MPSRPARPTRRVRRRGIASRGAQRSPSPTGPLVASVDVSRSLVAVVEGVVHAVRALEVLCSRVCTDVPTAARASTPGETPTRTAGRNPQPQAPAAQLLARTLDRTRADAGMTHGAKLFSQLGRFDSSAKAPARRPPAGASRSLLVS